MTKSQKHNILFVVLFIISNIITSMVTQSISEKHFIEEQYQVAISQLNTELSYYKQTDSRQSLSYAVSSLGSAVHFSYLLDDESNRIFRERSSLNKLYNELQSVNSLSLQVINDIQSICDRLEKDPYDMVAYGELKEIVDSFDSSK